MIRFGRTIRSGCLVVVVGGAAMAAACDDPFVVHEGGFSASAESGAFLVRNGSNVLESAQILVEQESSAIFDPAPCEQWPNRLEAGGERSIPHGDAFGYEPGADSVIVLWCFLSGDTRVDGGSITLPFR